MNTLSTLSTLRTGGSANPLWSLGSSRSTSALNTLSTLRTGGSANPLRSLSALNPLWSLGSSGSTSALNTLCTLWTRGTDWSLYALITLQASWTGRSLNSLDTLFTLEPLRASRTDRTLFTLWTRRSLGSDGSSGTLDSRYALFPLNSLGSLRSGRSRNSLDTLIALSARRSLGSGRTLHALFPLRSHRPFRTDQATGFANPFTDIIDDHTIPIDADAGWMDLLVQHVFGIQCLTDRCQSLARSHGLSGDRNLHPIARVKVQIQWIDFSQNDMKNAGFDSDIHLGFSPERDTTGFHIIDGESEFIISGYWVPVAVCQMTLIIDLIGNSALRRTQEQKQDREPNQKMLFHVVPPFFKLLSDEQIQLQITGLMINRCRNIPCGSGRIGKPCRCGKSQIIIASIWI